ncbi:MAG: hypothetical protein ACOZQL_29665 [Myxococcota bacterium]
MRALASLLLFTVVLAAALQAWVRHEQQQPPPLAKDRCASCHRAVEGLEASHARLSCAACHLGNAATDDATLAHVGLVRVPGNVADMDRTCGAAGCHGAMPSRLRANIMNTMNGVVSVDRWVFGEQPTPTAKTPVASLGHSPADTHLRNLCASCHLGNPKTEPGPLDQSSRGGGCNACHLVYSAEAEASLARRKDPTARFVHAALSVRPDPIACFGCHSRSGRVSLNVEGWQEFSGDAGVNAQLGSLADGRVLRKGPGDVHVERGLGCVDCHGSWELMGDGTAALHREEQAATACTDCHLTSAPRTLAFDAFDDESKAVARLEGFADAGRPALTIARTGRPLVNTFVADGGAFVVGKYSGRVARALPPRPECTAREHRALACGTCHEAWVPQCVSCHTRYEPDAGMFDLLANARAPGSWLETGADAFAEPASLGVRQLPDGGRRIEEFAPGMVLTLEHDGQPQFHRLFAPVFAHTIRREARSCESCHRSPLALGYGRGTLSWVSKERPCARVTDDPASVRRALEGAGQLQPTFSPTWPVRSEDGLPQDAWVGLLSTRGTSSTTREDTRPLSVAEQRRVLAVGVCLGCHPAGSVETSRLAAP